MFDIIEEDEVLEEAKESPYKSSEKDTDLGSNNNVLLLKKQKTSLLTNPIYNPVLSGRPSRTKTLKETDTIESHSLSSSPHKDKNQIDPEFMLNII